MTMTVQEFMQRFMDASFDQSNTRWPAPEVARYINDGQRDIALYRPDVFTTGGALATVAGARQTLPAGATKLLRVICNETSGKPVSMVSHELLDRSAPGWQAATRKPDVKNVTYDERVPLEYYCYPPSDGSARVRAIWASAPTDIPTPAGNTKADCTGNLSVIDTFINALLDYVTYRAFAKEGEIAENLDKAKFSYQMYAQALGIENSAKLEFGPNANSAQRSPQPVTKPAQQ